MVKPYFEVRGEIHGSRNVIQSCRTLSGESLEPLMRGNAASMFTIAKRYALKIIRTGEGMPPNVGKYAQEKQLGERNAGGYRAYFGSGGSMYGSGILSSIEKVRPLPYRQQTHSRYTGFVDPSTRGHALGKLSGDLYNGVLKQRVGNILSSETNIEVGKRGGLYSKTRDINISCETVFRDPPYIGYVHNGKPGVVARPFFTLATSIVGRRILQHMSRKFHQMGLSNPKTIWDSWTVVPTDSEFSDSEITAAYPISKIPRPVVSMNWWSSRNKGQFDED